MSIILLSSIGLKALALGGALWLFWSRRDRRPAALAVILALMTLRQILTLASHGTGTALEVNHLDELPELVLSLLAFVPLVLWRSRRSPRAAPQERGVTPAVHDAHSDAQRYLDIADVMLVALDAQGEITLINRQGCSVLGYDREDDLVRQNWFETCLPDRVVERTRTLFLDVMSGTTDESVVQHHENVVRTRSGAERLIKWHIDVLRDGAGRPTGTLSSGQDITDARRVENELLRFRLGIERSADVVFLTDTSGRITYVNPAFEQLYGYRAAEALGQTPRIIKSGLVPSEAYEEFWRKLLNKQVASGEIVNRAKDGRLLTVEGSASPVLNGEGEIIGFLAIQHDITERKRTEQALRESEERYRQIVETAQEGVWLIDGAGNTTYVNERMATILGRTADEMTGKSLFDYMDDEARTHAAGLFDQPRRGVVEQRETRFKHRDGSDVWTLVSTNPLFGDDGRFLGALSMIADITERMQAESRLRLSDSILGSLTNLVIVADAEGLIRYVSPSVTRLLGYRPEELLGAGWWHRTRDDPSEGERERVFAGLAAAGKAPISEQPYERPVKNAAGNDRWMLWHDSKGPGNLIIGIGYDVTARRLAEQARRESEERYRDLVEHATIGIFQASVEGGFLAVNPALVRMLGYASNEELMSADLVSDVFERPSDMDAVATALTERGSAQGMEVRWKRKDGATITARLTGGPVHTRSGDLKCYELFVEDVTEQRALEIQLRQAQKMEAVGQLTGGIAHDFNNLLTAILSNAELLAEALPEDSELRSGVSDILAAGERGAAMIRKLMAFSRRGQLVYETLEVGKLCAEVVHMLQRILPEHIEISADYGQPGWTVRADRGALEQILVNLATNARDAMPRGGSLRFAVERATINAAFCARQGWGQPGEYIRIEVRDTGTGMDELTRSRIFEPFFTTKPLGKGTGLGLATSYGLVKQQAGFIGVESELGRGTTVHVYLPFSAVDMVAEGELPDDDAPGGSETILVVEDEQDIRLVTGRMLERYGYCVLYAGDGEEALAILKARGSEIDLVISDLVLPRVPGEKLYLALRNWEERPKFMFSSGYTKRDLRDVGRLPTEVPLLQKPFSGRELAQSVRAVLDGGR